MTKPTHAHDPNAADAEMQDAAAKALFHAQMVGWMRGERREHEKLSKVPFSSTRAFRTQAELKHQLLEDAVRERVGAGDTPETIQALGRLRARARVKASDVPTDAEMLDQFRSMLRRKWVAHVYPCSDNGPAARR